MHPQIDISKLWFWKACAVPRNEKVKDKKGRVYGGEKSLIQ